MADKKSFPKAMLVGAIATWLGAAFSVYRIINNLRKQEGELFDPILMTVIFVVAAVAFTIQYRNAKQDL